MHFDYAFQNYDKTRHVRAALREKTISHKYAREISHSLKGKSIESSRTYLQSVTRLEHAVPFKRFNNEVGHKSDTGVMSGRYPRKAASEFLRLLDNLESNAEYRGMDLDRLKIVNATVHKGRKLERFTPRAMGRASPKIDILTHVELVAQEL
jgi:large subunit ribosomal protein L22